MFPQEVIIKKRNKEKLSKEEIDFFIKGVTSGEISDAQIGAFTMAVFLNGLDKEETRNLTFAMRDSGDVLKWDYNTPPLNFKGRSGGDYQPSQRAYASAKMVDKHSSGGVGDKVSLMLAPMLACCGAKVPMISGRGLGYTGGTLDKFDSIPGYQTSPSNELFKKTVDEVGCAIIGQTGNLAPADKKIYAIRDVCGTVESVPLITASILSKKLAAGLSSLVMDLKCGNGAFMKNIDEARTLAHSIVNVSNIKTTAVITDMNQVLGRNVGNALEVLEAVEYLKGNRDSRLHEVTMILCEELLGDRDKIEENLNNGKALQTFQAMVTALGGPRDFVDFPEKYLPKAKIIKPLFSPIEGYVESMNTAEVGMALIGVKGGRTTPEQKLDYATGFSDFCQIGDLITKEIPLCIIHAQNEQDWSEAAQRLLKNIKISSKKPTLTSVIIEKVK